MRRAILGLLAPIAALTLTATATPAVAFQFPSYKAGAEPACPLNDGWVFYSFTPNSDPAQVEYARQGFAQWNNQMEVNGMSYMTNITEVPFDSPNVSPYRVLVTVANFGSLGVNFVRNCTEMRLNTLWGPDVLRGGAAHEMGHVLGLHHTGVEDSFAGEEKDFYPAMTTCLASVYETELMSVKQDDRAALQFFHGDKEFDRFYYQFLSATANPGIENGGARHWTARPGSTISSQTTTAANSMRSLYLRSSTGPAEVFQRVTFAPGDLSGQPHLVFAAIKTKKHVSTDTGLVQLSILERTVNYEQVDEEANIGNGRCEMWKEYSITANANKRQYTGDPVQVGYASCVPKTTWSPCQTESGYTRGSSTSLYDASDLYVQARSTMTSSPGAYSGVDLDDIHIGYYNQILDPI